eukprot:COSAG06_NODE_32717_length_501_cov_1.452736_2_plen_24_part_01
MVAKMAFLTCRHRRNDRVAALIII